MALCDTHPEASRRQVHLVQRASVARRFELARSLTRSVVLLSRRGLRRRHPDATPVELDRAFVELHYGATLARRLFGEP